MKPQLIRNKVSKVDFSLRLFGIEVLASGLLMAIIYAIVLKKGLRGLVVLQLVEWLDQYFLFCSYSRSFNESCTFNGTCINFKLYSGFVAMFFSPVYWDFDCSFVTSTSIEITH
jgi:hypothetical protein